MSDNDNNSNANGTDSTYSVVLVETFSGSRRYIGELYAEDCLSTDGEQLSPDECTSIRLRKAYEVVRAQIPTPQGPRLVNMFASIGMEGPMSWSVINPGGITVLGQMDPMVQQYMSERAADSGIVLATNAPPPGLGAGPGGGVIVPGR